VENLDFEFLGELLKVGATLATFGSVSALRAFIKNEASSTVEPLARDCLMLRDDLDELRDDHVEHMGDFHDAHAAE
jgi:hypothetical protein